MEAISPRVSSSSGPITPLEPLPELYATLRRMKTGGDDMSGAALRLMAGGVRTITDAGGSPVAGSELISAKEVQKVLENNRYGWYTASGDPPLQNFAW